MSIQQTLVFVLTFLLVFPAELRSAPREQLLKEKLIEIPTGSVVSVKLDGKPQVRGKLGTVNDAGFQVQTVANGSVSTQTINYSEVKSVKQHGKGMSTAAKVTIGVLVGVGATIGILVAVVAANGWD